MNTVGKTLVVVNLLFALLTGGFLVVDFMTRENWKKRVEDYEREIKVASTKTAEDATTIGKAMVALREAQKKIDELENKVKDDEAKFKRDLAEAKVETESHKFSSDKQQLAQMVVLDENRRLKEEAKGLRETLAKREQSINQLEVDKNSALNQAVTALGQKDAADQRSSSLLDRVRELEIALIKANVPGVPAAGTAKNTNAPNPPPAFVKGVVEKVDSSGLVQLSIGTDAGVGVNNTLEAYRLRPRPEYLGMIRIIDANHHKAVGRLMRVPSVTQQPTLREGDEVSSTLTPPS